MNISMKGPAHYRIHVGILCLFFIRVWMAPGLMAQEINMDRKVEVSNQVLTIEQLLNELHNKYAVNFSYNNENLPLSQSVRFKSTTCIVAGNPEKAG